MRVASAQSTRSSQKSPLLSIDDVYKLAERTRMRTSLEARHLVLAQTQTIMVRNICPGVSRPLTRSVSTSRNSFVNKGDRDKNTSPLDQTSEKGEGQGQGQWQGQGQGQGTAEQDPERGEEENTAPPPLGFVRNVHISFKPRLTALSHSGFNDGSAHRMSFRRSQTVSTDFVTSSNTDATSPGVAGEESRDTPACQCIDGTAPGVCRECRKARAESEASARLQTTFPALNLHEKYVMSSALVRRARPDMTPREIQEKLATGEIASSALIFPRRGKNDNEENEQPNSSPQEENENRDLDSDEMDVQGRNSNDNQPKQTTSSPASNAGGSPVNSMALLGRLKLQFRSGEATTPLYFTDLRHMNSKIFHGRTGRSLQLPGGEQGKKKRMRTDFKPLWPAFVSPRRTKLIEEPAYRAYFDPPLLAKRKQIPNPAFFAGSDDIYWLPERLPDMLEFAGGNMAITDPNTLVSDSSSRPAESPGAPGLGTPAVAAKSPGTPAVAAKSPRTPAVAAKSPDTPALGTPAVAAKSPGTPAVAAKSPGTPCLGTPALAANSAGTPALGTPAVAKSPGTPALATKSAAAPDISASCVVPVNSASMPVVPDTSASIPVVPDTSASIPVVPVTSTSTAVPLIVASTTTPVSSESSVAVTDGSTAAFPSGVPLTSADTVVPLTSAQTVFPVTSSSSTAPVTPVSAALPVPSALAADVPVTQESSTIPVTSHSSVVPGTSASTVTCESTTDLVNSASKVLVTYTSDSVNSR